MPLKQLLTKPEAELDGLASGRKITKFRVIDDAGASINASAEQIATTIAPSLGIDYSLLTEQAVPGEFALNRNQVRSQVYARTFVGTVPDATWTHLITLPNSGCVIDVWGSTLQSTSIFPNQPISAASVLRGASGANTYGLSFPGKIGFLSADVLIGATYCVTLKYVK